MSKKTRFQMHCEDFISSKSYTLIHIDDIDKSDLSMIAAEVFKLAESIEDPYEAYIKVISKYGIMCPHPQNKRLYGGYLKSASQRFDFRWFNCGMCECSVIDDSYDESSERPSK